MNAMVGRKLLNEIDWSLSDAEIARIAGVSRERIRQVRQQFKFGRAEMYRSHPKSIKFYLWARSNYAELFQMQYGSSVEEIVQESGINVSIIAARRVLLILGIDCPLYSHKDPLDKYRRFNWDLPNRDLSNIWNIHPVVISKYRRLLNGGRGRWHGRTTNSAGFIGTPEWEEYQKALQKEHELAARTMINFYERWT